MTDVDEARLRSTTRADVWVHEFLKVVPDVDPGLMLGWFANAIETGRLAAGETRELQEQLEAWRDLAEDAVGYIAARGGGMAYEFGQRAEDLRDD